VSSTPDPGAHPRAERSTGEDLAFSDRWGESIKRSRRRRIATAIKRRRRFRSRGAVMSAVAVLAVSGAGAGVAGAQSADSTYLAAGSSGSQVSAVEQTLGVPADGYFDEQLTKAVRGFQSENGLAVDGVVGPETAGALGVASASPEAAPSESAAPSSGGGSTGASGNATLEQIAQCESGGDPTAVSSDGQYRGKYQFTRETWAALGGSGDPAAAPESEQDEMAAQLLAQSGTSSWPSCG
jgi:Transglycosylase-like domain/Putative peptidoglycan binding domain